MELETAQSLSSKNATVDDVRQAVHDDALRGEYLILSKGKDAFVQAAGESEPFYVEYCEDQAGPMFRCKAELAGDQLETLLINYLNGDADWNAAHDWEAIPDKPWWKFW